MSPAAPRWTTPADLRQQVLRYWERGELLGGELLGGELLGDERLGAERLGAERLSSESPNNIFPKRLTLKTPSATELRDHFAAVRAWSESLRALPHLRIEWREFRHQVFGQNSLPATAWLDTPEAGIALISKTKEARIFAEILRSTAEKQPKLRPWLAKRPLRAIELADEWDKLLAVVDWLLAHPRPGIYLRQMDIPGIHSKFIESRRALLTEWLDLLLPAENIDFSAVGSSQFNRRYGFRDKPQRIRWRYLDPACAPLAHFIDADITLDAAAFARLNPAVDRVFITENEINFLSFPPVDRSILLFGAGYGFSALAEAGWLHAQPLHYWGDIDTHGFAILDELRSHFPKAQSLLMDEATLLEHRALWGEESTAQTRPLTRLNAAEAALYADLCTNRWQARLRLEQEHIGYAWARTQILRCAD